MVSTIGKTELLKILIPTNFKAEKMADDACHCYLYFCGKLTILRLLWCLAALICSTNLCWAKGPLDREVARFSENTLTPILVQSGLCNSHQDCREKEYFFCVSWESISCDVYGITDEKLIKEILGEVLKADFKVRTLNFWQSKHHQKKILEQPLLTYTNHLGE